MANGDIPDHRDLWEAVNQSRLELAELKGMVKMHFDDRQHHIPPCKPAADMQKTILSALAAAVIAMLGAICNLVLAVVK